jgi:hypothetical protein
MKHFYFFGIFFLIFFSLNLYAQVSTAQIEGRILDSDGNPLPNVNVVAQNIENGLSRGTITSKSGSYFLGGLQPGKYKVTASFIGYRKETREVEILIGQIATINFTLYSEAIPLGTVEVKAEAPIFELKRTDVSMPVRKEQITNLPLDTRNIMQLAALVPGIRAFSPIGGRALPEAGSLPPLRFIQLYVDGVEWKSYYNGNIVGIPQTGSPLSQEAVQEFRVILNAFDPEYTRGTSYIISAVTPRGTNEYRATAFVNARDKSLNSRGPFQTTKPDYQRQQLGFSISGPLQKDKLFFFASYELNNEKNYIDVVPGRPSYNPSLWDSYKGTFESPTENHTGLIKLTYQASNSHTLDLTWATRYMNSKFYFGGTVAYTAGIYGRYHVNSYLLKDTWIISPELMNELTLHYLRWRHDEPLIQPGPAYIYPSITLGRGIFPIRLSEDHYRIVNKTTYRLSDFYGDHIIKGGFEFTRAVNKPWFPYYFDGQFSFATDTSTLPRTATIGIGFNNPYSTDDAEGSLSGYTVGAFIQDRWRVLPNLTLSFGMRWDADINLLNNKNKVRWADSADIKNKISPDFLNNGDRENDLDNFAPRFSFNWDPFGTDKLIIRGGYGIFFDRTANYIGYFEQLYSNWGIYTFINPTTTDPNVLRNLILSGQGQTKPTLYLLNKRMTTPAVYQWSIGFANQLFDNFGLSIDYINNHATSLYVATNANYYIPSQRRRAISDNYGDIYLWGSYGRAFYHAFLFSFLYKTPNISTQLSYTLSWNYSDFDGSPTAVPFGSSYQLQRSSGDERHRFVLNWIVDLPYKFQVSGVATLASPAAFAVIDGRDLNDNNYYNDDWPGGMRNIYKDWKKIRNWYKMFDLRVSKSFQYLNYKLTLVFDAFNLFNWFNAASYFNRMYDANGNPYSNYAQPNSSYAPRYLQLGFRMSYN